MTSQIIKIDLLCYYGGYPLEQALKYKVCRSTYESSLSVLMCLHTKGVKWWDLAAIKIIINTLAHPVSHLAS